MIKKYWEMTFSLVTRQKVGNHEAAIRKSKEVLKFIYKIESKKDQISHGGLVDRTLLSLKTLAYIGYGRVCLNKYPEKALWGLTKAQELANQLNADELSRARLICEILYDMSTAYSKIGDSAKRQEMLNSIRALRGKVRLGFTSNMHLNLMLADLSTERGRMELMQSLSSFLDNKNDKNRTSAMMVGACFLRCAMTFHNERQHGVAKQCGAQLIELMNDANFDFHGSIAEMGDIFGQPCHEMWRHREFCADNSCAVLECLGKLEKHMSEEQREQLIGLI